jgi:lipopolysaccharide cholinephosphotransferase|tara:strand:- start:111 stop:947 length:837 start_codon:yes stop_codon:yes gene_type:complete
MSKVKIEEIQDKLLEIAVYFDIFCKKNNIIYYLMGGSALGAIRHKGFIPWDDDIDVFMTYHNYIKFIEACEKNLDTNNFYLQKENTKEWPLFFSKLRMNGTTFIEEDTKSRQMHQGFYIDIMCLNNVSSNFFYRYIQFLAARLITVKTIAKKGYITNSNLKKISMFIFKRLIGQNVLKQLVKIVRSLNNKDTKYVGHFFGRAKFKNTSFLRQYLGSPRYVKFSKIMLPVQCNVEKYLEIRYGPKYMEMPDEKTKSLYPSHSAFVDLNNSYKNYVNNNF